MGKYLNKYFLIGMVIGILPVIIYSSYVKNNDVLSASSSVYDQSTSEPSDTPAPTTELTETPSPTPTDTPTPTPKPTPTEVPTPTPTPTATPEITAPADLEPLFSEFSNQYGVDVNLLKQIADCESHFNPAVVSGPYAGMFQFTQRLWIKYRNLMVKDPNPDLRFGARESIETAAFIIKTVGTGPWPICSR